MSIAYNVSLALSGLEEAQMRRKGEQNGTVRRKGDAWYVRFYQWQADEAGNLAYVQIERRIAGEYPANERGRRLAQSAGYDQWVSKANAVSKVPQGLATVEQFYEMRFVPDHVSLLKKNGRAFYRTIWGHIKPTLGAVQLKEVSAGVVQALVAAKVSAGMSPQTVKHIRNCIRAIFKHARNLGFTDAVKLPTDGVKLPALVH
jgi:hypothetical protein